MPRALKDILTELDTVYNPQRETYNTQLQAVDPQLQAEQQGLEAQKRDAFDQITTAANRRGLFYSGLPIAEEQRYTGQQFLPAIANLRAKYASQRFGLQDAIAKLTADQYNQAYGVQQKERELEEEQRQFNERLAAQRASSAGGVGGAFGPTINSGMPKQNMDYAGSAREDALKLRTQFFNTGAAQTPFQREKARDALLAKYGNVLSEEEILNIIYKDVFPDTWAGYTQSTGEQMRGQAGKGNEVIYTGGF